MWGKRTNIAKCLREVSLRCDCYKTKRKKIKYKMYAFFYLCGIIKNMEKVKNVFKNWSVFELFLLICSPIAVLTAGIVFDGDWLTVVTSIVGIFCALFLAKGLAFGQFLGVAIAILYSIVSFKNGFYGEVLIYTFISLPMYIWGVIAWLRHKNPKTQTVEINIIKLQEWIIVGICAVVIFIGFYFMLKAFNTKELIVSTLSVVDNIFAHYLLIRRSKYGFVSYIVNDLILIILWGIPIIQGSFMLIAMLINPIVNLINDTYGFVNWTKTQKKQRN